MSPGSRQIIGGAGIGAHLPAHIPTAPGPGLAASAMIAVSGIVIMMPGSIMLVMVSGGIMVVMVPGSIMVMVVMGVP